MRKPKIIIVMPAYFAEKTLEKTVNSIPKGLAAEIIVIDDASTDGTSSMAKKLGLIVHKNKKNIGYGGSQKIGYDIALSHGADIILLLHADFQYDPTLASEMIKPIEIGLVDMMLGTRIRSRSETLSAGMPFYKYICNRFLTITENIVLGLNLSEYHTGYRAYNSNVLKTLPYHNFSDDFLFDSELLISSANSHFRFGEIPVAVRYFEEASSISFRRSLSYGFGTLLTLSKYIIQHLNLGQFNIFHEK